MMRLDDLLTAAGPHLAAQVASPPQIGGDAWQDLAIHDVVCDSRQARPGCLFVAVRGGLADGLRFAADAVAAGAAALVVGEQLGQADLVGIDVPIVRVARPRAAVGMLAAALHDFPSRRLDVLAVTGTNGKTTTAVLAAQFLCASGRRAAALGTLGLWTPAGLVRGGLTTPDGADLQRRLAELASQGFDAVVLEASSHALDQDRLVGTTLQAAAYTNLGRDHLDYHGTLAAYAAAKALLFQAFNLDPARAFVNMDEPALQPLVNAGNASGFSFVGHAHARVQVAGLVAGRHGLSLTLSRDGKAPLSLDTQLLGRHNAENLVAAALLAGAVGVSDDVLRAAAGSLVAPPGRLQPVGNELGAIALVDYAHTPDALRAVLRVCGEVVAPTGRVVVVFGCGGDRDAGKRPQMGAAAAQFADVCVVTSDNPRSEAPADIVAAVVDGAVAAGAMRVEKLVPSTLPAGRASSRAADASFVDGAGAIVVGDVDRERAIRRAIGLLGAGDVLLVAGKGHEITQTIGEQVLPFDDAEVVGRWFAQRRGAGPRVGGSVAHRVSSPPTAAVAVADVAEVAIDGAIVIDGVGAAAICGGALVTDGARLAHGVGSDSRVVAVDSVFVALRGDRFDGHAFILKALQDGAAGVVVARGEAAACAEACEKAGAFAVEVDDTLVAFGDLARHHRRRVGEHGLRVVGVTGSNGKTSTKELLALALAPFGATLATYANHNNRIGVPQTLFGLRPHHALVVVEMGMSVPGEIAELARIAEPSVGVVTSVAEAHLAGLGSLAAIAHEKAALLRALPSDGVAIIPMDCDVLDGELDAVVARVVRFGLTNGDVHLVGAPRWHDGQQHFVASVFGCAVEVVLPALGVHMVSNALAALAVAGVVGDNIEAAARQLARYQPVGQRLRPLRLAGRLVLEDCYNANPSSVESALHTLRGLPAPRIAVLGEMRELGPTAESLHRRVARAAVGIDRLVALGPFASVMALAAREVGVQAVAVDADDIEAAADAVIDVAVGGATVLVKGSRGARLERVVDALRVRWTAEEAA